jgi:hypothetical protein
VYNLTTFGFSDMMSCRRAIRTLFEEEPRTLAEAAERVVNFLYCQLVDDSGRPACALVRLFKTHAYAELDDELQSFVRETVPLAAEVENLRCLVLLATAGDRADWRSRHASQGHKAIALVSEQMVEQAPMIAQLIEQFGLSVSTVLHPNPTLLLENATTINLFYVPQAVGSPYIVAQEEFVIRHGIQSVLGFGGILASGDLFAVIMFSRVPITPDIADRFKVVGLNLKLAILPLVGKPLFVP